MELGFAHRNKDFGMVLRGKLDMLKTEIKICKKCGRPYVVKTGGYVGQINEDDGICKVCKLKKIIPDK